MGRRSFISMTAINRMISASNSRKREKERLNLINSQGGTQKELPPTYSLLYFDFNINTRAAKIIFEQSQQYRTIERYVTQNHVRYPILSGWKTKSKKINKTIKLTNQALETLNHNADKLIRDFSEEIVASLDNEELLPSWFIKTFLKNELDDKIVLLKNESKTFAATKQTQIKSINAQINKTNSAISEITPLRNREIAQRDRIDIKLQKVENAKKSAIKSIFTFGIYSFLISNKRKTSLKNKKSFTEQNINSFNERIRLLESELSVERSKITNIEAEIDIENQTTETKIQKETDIYNEKLNAIQPLPSDLKEDVSFILLKSFIGLEYKKIIGCYVIHNRENNKFYVGQSKDVIKRLKQHFKGTVPANIIFAEDYYTSKMENKDNLFEVKIIPCETKDELDSTEKQLIEDYDAFNSGYNGTSGNT